MTARRRHEASAASGEAAARGDPPHCGFARLVALMHRLRAPGGCPWDAEQTHDSIKKYLIEEAFEAAEAIEHGSDIELRDELGDVLLQVVFHAEMAAERGAFDVAHVIEGLCEKLIRRHPHVFADVSVDSSAEVVENWSRIKAEERADASADGRASALDGVPRALPALMRAHRLGQKAEAVGFDWDSVTGVRRKLDEELAELDAALARDDPAEIAAELGDVLFTTASVARKLGLDAESVLRAALTRFERRFRELEGEMAQSGTTVRDSSAAELDAAWRRIKARE